MLLLTAVTIPHTLAHTEDKPLTANLIAGGGNPNSEMVAGIVTVWNDDDYLYVTYDVPCPWWLTETHLHVATDADGIPHTQKGNPIPGKFDYKTHGYAHVFTYPIPLNGWTTDTELFIAAHAVVCYYECGCETAWGAGSGFSGKNWATYFTYTVQ